MLVGAVVQGVAMGTFLLVGAIWPRDRDQGVITRDSVRNLFNGLALYGVRVTLVAWIAAELEWGLFNPEWLDDPALQFAAAFLLVDFCRYWLHVAHHRVPWLWTFHRVHHSAESLDATTGLRMHLVDFLQLSLLPVVLFGAVINTSDWASWVVPAALSVGVVSDAFQHGNIRWNPRHPIAVVWNLALNHPHFHVWHHTRDGHLCDGNYGNALVIWDRLFRTEVTQALPPPLLGLEADQAVKESLLGWHLLRPRAEV